MCGIAGFRTWAATTVESMGETVREMAARLRHRGPDGSGVWVGASAGVALGHARLSVLDLTPTGNQPMASADGRLVLTYNGEVYNHREIRAELEGLGRRFRGRSDTEVVLAAVAEWGVEGAVPKFNGMFAMGVWDAGENALTLVRDRLGIKPLYYCRAGQAYLFASEIKSFYAFPGYPDDIDPGAVALFFRHNCIPSPHSIHSGTWKLPPGHILKLTGGALSSAPVPECYWSALRMAEDGVASPFAGTEREAEEVLDAMLARSVKERMEADVPVGAFLSGGIDSSTVAAMMCRAAPSPDRVRTFTVGFQEAGYDESPYARAVAAHLGTNHAEFRLSPSEAMSVIPSLPDIYDEPFSDSSQIPAIVVSRLAREHVKACLSGDGGDELFGGYNRYFWAERIWKWSRRCPPTLRNWAVRAMKGRSAESWDAFFRKCSRVCPPLGKVPAPGDRIHKLARIVGECSPHAVYRSIVSHWEPAVVAPGIREPETSLSRDDGWPHAPDFFRWMQFMDLVTYLPDDILVKVDRASMSVGLEVRAPMLDDHRVAEFAWTLPTRMKTGGKTGKRVLRKVLGRLVPERVLNRPKTGFAIPLGAWLKTGLRDWAEHLLDERALLRDGVLDAGVVRKAWGEHLKGGGNWQYLLWDVLVFRSWMDGRRAVRGGG